MKKGYAKESWRGFCDAMKGAIVGKNCLEQTSEVLGNAVSNLSISVA